MKLRHKILSITGITLILFTLALATALFGMHSAQQRFQQYLDVDQALLQEETTMYASGLQMGQALRNIIMDPDNRTAYDNFDAAATAFTTALENARDIATDMPQNLQVLTSISSIRERHIKEQEHIIDLAYRQDEAIDAISQRETPVWREMRALLIDSIEEHRQQVDIASQNMRRLTTKIFSSSLLFGLLGLIACSALMLWLARHLLSQLGGEPAEAQHIANAIAAGDFTQTIPLAAKDNNSLMYSMAQMQSSLAQMTLDIQQAAAAIDEAANEISTGNLNLSARTESQAAGLEQTAAAMEEITSTVRLNADNAGQANQLADNASTMATQSESAVGHAVSTMHDIRDSSNRIVEIIDVIDGIAFQTNILALNAAVEAARAGESGRGFAVVASEVRSLAQRSASAAADIKTLIDNSVKRIEAGNLQMSEAGESVTGLMQSIQDVALIMDEITNASQEQSVGISQIDQAIHQIDDTTQQNATLVQDATRAAQSLNEQAARLKALIAQYKLPSHTQGRLSLS